eukprot:11959773-Prorocentrum_lima.AAC.1
MTSSLVGSEMCIRDSSNFENFTLYRRATAQRSRFQPAPANGRGHDREAVSYTHLTLPTICSV